MPSQGATAGTGENNAGIGATAWTTPGNITANDGTNLATCNAAASSQYLVARNFGFTVPTGSTINGIDVFIEATEHSGGTEALKARLQNDLGALIGTEKASSISGNISGTTMVLYEYGGTTDVWGATLTPAIVNDPDFGVRFWFTTAHDVRVDYVAMDIYYTEPSGAMTAVFATTMVATANPSGSGALSANYSTAMTATGVAGGTGALSANYSTAMTADASLTGTANLTANFSTALTTTGTLLGDALLSAAFAVAGVFSLIGSLRRRILISS